MATCIHCGEELEAGQRGEVCDECLDAKPRSADPTARTGDEDLDLNEFDITDEDILLDDDDDDVEM